VPARAGGPPRAAGAAGARPTARAHARTDGRGGGPGRTRRLRLGLLVRGRAAAAVRGRAAAVRARAARHLLRNKREGRRVGARRQAGRAGAADAVAQLRRRARGLARHQVQVLQRSRQAPLAAVQEG